MFIKVSFVYKAIFSVAKTTLHFVTHGSFQAMADYFDKSQFNVWGGVIVLANGAIVYIIYLL